MEAAGSGGAGRELINPVAATATATAEDEAAKRNTDCVYFLASPLTCKKGSECEYRHSEGARMNPRDCWYWLNGNCLNPKCSFRHPPLDGLYGPLGTTTSGPSQPPTQTVSSMQISGTHASGHILNKQSVPCYYFQKGGCLKGDKCPFMHVPQTIGNPGPQATMNSITQQAPKVPASDSDQSQTLKKDSWGLKECIIQQPKVSLEKTEVRPSSTKPEALSNNGLLHKKSCSPYPVDNDLPKSQLAYVPLSSNDSPNVPLNRQLWPTDEHLQYGLEADEFVPESSPGFDVLVDDNSEDPAYFHNKDDYGRGGRNLNPVNDFDYHHSDYELVPHFERDRYNGMGEHERDGWGHSHHGWEQCRRSSERVLERQSMYDRRALEREETLNEIDGSDLRHQLLKQRRLNGTRSAINTERRREPYHRDDQSAEDRHRGRGSNRDQRRYPHESSISSRLRGRITLPRRSSPDTPVDFRSEKARDRERHQGRLSPARPINNYEGRHHDRIRRRMNEEVTADVRNSGRQPIKRDDAESLDFAGPKSLAELKGAKNAESFQDQQPRKDQGSMKPTKAIGSQESEGSFTFKGPKPLSTILKRKRETTCGNGALSGRGDENHKKYRDGPISSVSVVASSVHPTHSSEADKEGTREEEEEEGLIRTGAEELHDDSHSATKDEIEDGMIVDTMEDRDLENDDQRDRESDYEGGDFRTEDDENMHQDDEDLDDEDDFARKVGMILS